MSVKTYANVMQELSGCDFITAYLNNDYDAVKRVFDNPSKEEANRVGDYDFATGSFSFNKIVPEIIRNWGKTHNLNTIIYNIHTPQVGGGSFEDYRAAVNSVKEFRKNRGLELAAKTEEVELEEVKTKTR